MRRSLSLLTLALAGCFTDYAPSTSNAPGGESSATSDAGSSTGPQGDDDDAALLDSHDATDSSESSDTSDGSSSTDATSTTDAVTSIAQPHDVTAPPETPHDMCLAGAAELDCGECLCDACAPQFLACAADPGCVAIRGCAASIGCDLFECAGPCARVIDEHGGLGGESTALALALGLCIPKDCGC